MVATAVRKVALALQAKGITEVTQSAAQQPKAQAGAVAQMKQAQAEHQTRLVMAATASNGLTKTTTLAAVAGLTALLLLVQEVLAAAVQVALVPLAVVQVALQAKQTRAAAQEDQPPETKPAAQASSSSSTQTPYQSATPAAA